MSKDKKEYISGPFSAKEDKFIRENYRNMTDQELADALGRKKYSVAARRRKLGITDKKAPDIVADRTNRDAYLSSLDDDEKEAFYRKELKSTSFYKNLKNGVLSKEELLFLEDKWVEFMLDPSIETVTAPERDVWQQMTLAEIRMLRYMREERQSDEAGEKKDLQRQITDCQTIIEKCQKSLNLQRDQRLKNQNDQSATFVTIVQHLKDPATSRELGYEAAMMKFMAESHYNDKSSGKNIISGSDVKFDINKIFKDNKAPTDINVDFTGQREDD